MAGDNEGDVEDREDNREEGGEGNRHGEGPHQCHQHEANETKPWEGQRALCLCWMMPHLQGGCEWQVGVLRER